MEHFFTTPTITTDILQLPNMQLRDIGVEIIAMHHGIGWGKDKEYSHKIDGNTFGNTLCLSPHPIP